MTCENFSVKRAARKARINQYSRHVGIAMGSRTSLFGIDSPNLSCFLIRYLELILSPSFNSDLASWLYALQLGIRIQIKQMCFR